MSGVGGMGGSSENWWGVSGNFDCLRVGGERERRGDEEETYIRGNIFGGCAVDAEGGSAVGK